MVTLSVMVLAPRQVSADVESDLNRQWRGAWVLTKVETVSGCSGSYTNNDVRGSRVSGKGDRFAAGEIAIVHKVNLNRKRVEVLVDLDEPVLVPRQDGPFTLFDERFCKVELRMDLAGLKPNDPRVEGLIDVVLERHADRARAVESELWNRRLREPYPPDYDQTLAEYEGWKIFQANAAVQSEMDLSIEEAGRILDRLVNEPDALDGFGRGVDDAREESWTSSCERLVSMTEASWVGRGSGERNSSWRKGYRQGQSLVFHLERARRLRGCFVPPPAP